MTCSAKVLLELRMNNMTSNGDAETIDQPDCKISEPSPHNPYITPAHRRELFSFALLRCLELDDDQQQMYLSCSSTIRRLRAGEEKLKQARRYYAAKQSIKNVMD